MRLPARGDLVAGLNVALVLVPQSLAYAEIAGLTPVHGLYAAVAARGVGQLDLTGALLRRDTVADAAARGVSVVFTGATSAQQSLLRRVIDGSGAGAPVVVE